MDEPQQACQNSNNSEESVTKLKLHAILTQRSLERGLFWIATGGWMVASLALLRITGVNFFLSLASLLYVLWHV